jgi:predicted Zn finger-like uncharacterized protein
MPNVIKCPECQKSLRLNESLAGKRVRCPACKQPFLVPGGVDELEEVPPSEAESEEEEDTGVQARRPARRSRPEPDEDEEEDERPARRSRRARDEEDEDDEEEERPRRPRRRRRRGSGGDASAGTGPLVMGILSIVFCCFPIVGVILGGLAMSRANTAMANLPGSSRFDAARGRLQVAKILGIIGMVLSIGMFVTALALNFTNR